MRRITLGALLVAPLLLVTPGRAAAQHQCFDGPFKCGGFCVGLCSKIHQHGPLYNYGPYTGYAPFGPYGPWNEYLQWTGENYGPGNCHGKHKSHTGNPHPLCGGHGCGGGFSPLLSHFHKGKCSDGGCGTAGCSSCGGKVSANEPPAPAGMGQYAGYPAQPNPYAAAYGYGYGYPAAYGYGYGYGYGYPYTAANYSYGPYQAPQQSPVMPAGASGR